MKRLFAGAMACAAIVGGGAATVAMATPASASPVFTVWDPRHIVEGQLDQNPADGAAAWVWGWNEFPSSGGGYIEYEFYDGSMSELYLNSAGGGSTELSAPVWRIRACSEVYAVGEYSCGAWS